MLHIGTKAAGYYDEKLSLTTDLELWLRLARQGDAASTTAVQGIVRAHAGNASAYTRAARRGTQRIRGSVQGLFRKEGR
jgi:hypothetical protein